MGRNVILAMAMGMLTAVAFFFLWSLFVDPIVQPVLLPTVGAVAVMPEPVGTVLPLDTAVPVQLATPQSQTVTVQAGDTLFSIARAYDITLIELTSANGIVDPNQIEVGQVLLIPNRDTPTTVSTPPVAETSVANSTNATPSERQTTLNGLPIDSFVILPENVIFNVKNIYAQGQTLGNNPRAFSKVGDSTIQIPYFLARFDQLGGYNLGAYAYLQPTIDYFAGSFNREGTAVRKGFHSWSVNDPAWADKTICQPNETPIACEIRIQRPAVIFIRLGSNDAGVPEMFDQNLRQIVELAIVNGVIPVIGTKADRAEGSNINNEILRRIAADYEIPLWDFDLVAGTLPGRGLDVDNVHLTTFYAHDYTLPQAFQQGHGVHNLTALMVLDALMNGVLLEGGD